MAHHSNIHRGLQKVLLAEDQGDYEAAVKEMIGVEKSSDIGFKELLQAVKESSN